jgi:hypothetical protein
MRLGRARRFAPIVKTLIRYAAPAGSGYALTAPGTTSGPAGVTSGNFTVTPNGAVTATITPSDGAGGTFTPSSLSWSAAANPQTFTYTPPSSGSTPGTSVVRTISTTNNAGLTNPGGVSYTAVALVNVLFLGDSFTGDSSTTTVVGVSTAVYPYFIMQKLRDDLYGPAHFDAIPGTTIENFEAYSPAPDALYNAAAPLNVCVVLGGANNFNVGQTAAAAYGHLQACCATRRGVGWKVVVCTLFAGEIIGGPASLGAGDYNVLRNAFNALLRAGWRSFADGLIDYASSPLIGKDGNESSTTYFADGLHPTNTGKAEQTYYATGVIAEVVYPGGSAGGGGGGGSIIGSSVIVAGTVIGIG